MTPELIAEAFVSVLLGGVMLMLARMHWRMERTGESIRQTFLLGALGLGLIIGGVLAVALSLVIPYLGGQRPTAGISIWTGMVIGAGGYAFGRLVEKRYDRRRAAEEDDYWDP